jgi:hypothetical protein
MPNYNPITVTNLSSGQDHAIRAKTLFSGGGLDDRPETPISPKVSTINHPANSTTVMDSDDELDELAQSFSYMVCNLWTYVYEPHITFSFY